MRIWKNEIIVLIQTDGVTTHPSYLWCLFSRGKIQERFRHSIRRATIEYATVSHLFPHTPHTHLSCSDGWSVSIPPQDQQHTSEALLGCLFHPQEVHMSRPARELSMHYLGAKTTKLYSTLLSEEIKHSAPALIPAEDSLLFGQLLASTMKCIILHSWWLFFPELLSSVN